jgi:hypothetical protein
MSEHDERHLITMECLHTTFFRAPAPKIGDTIWCLRCRKETVVRYAPNEWRIRCRECIYSRSFGADQASAQLSIGRHRRKFPTHAVRLINGNKLVETYGNECQETLSDQAI